MLPHEPETIEQMKVRFPAAVSEPVDVEDVRLGRRAAPTKDRKHVFDFDDGMRLAVSVDETCGSKFLHVSASGDDNYVETIKDEGLDGFVQDVLLRLAALRGKVPEGPLKSFLTEQGVLHIVFEKK